MSSKLYAYFRAKKAAQQAEDEAAAAPLTPEAPVLQKPASVVIGPDGVPSALAAPAATPTGAPPTALAAQPGPAANAPPDALQFNLPEQRPGAPAQAHAATGDTMGEPEVLMPETMPASRGDTGIALMSGVAGRGQREAAQQQGELNTSFDAEQRALRDKQNILETQAVDTAPLRADEARLAQKFEAQTAAAHVEAKEATDKQVSYLRDLETKLSAADAAKGFWANKSVGSKIGWAIATGLGAFAQSASRGEIKNNGAMDMFDRALQEDRQDKARELATMRDRIQGERNILGDIRQNFASDQSALQANYVAGIGKIESQIKAVLASTQDKVVIADGQMALAQLGERKQAALQNLQHQAYQENFQAAHAISGALQTQDQLDFTRMISKYNAERKAAATAAGLTYRDAVPGFRPSQNETDYHALQKEYATYRHIHDPLSKIADTLAPKVNGKRVARGAIDRLSPEAQADLSQLGAIITMEELDLFKRGAAVSPEEWQLVNAVRGVGPGGRVAWETFAPATVAKIIDRADKYFKNRVYDVAISSGQMHEGDDPLAPDNMAKFNWQDFDAHRPMVQKAVKGN